MNEDVKIWLLENKEKIKEALRAEIKAEEAEKYSYSNVQRKLATGQIVSNQEWDMTFDILFPNVCHKHGNQ